MCAGGQCWRGYGSSSEGVPQKRARVLWNAAKEREFMDNLKRELKIESLEDWRAVTVRVIANRGGRGLIDRHRGSVLALLQSCYPEEDITPWRCRKKLPANFWDFRENGRAFLEDVAKRMHLRKPSDWMDVTSSQVAAYGGRGLLAKYPSLLEAVIDLVDGAETLSLDFPCAAARGQWSDKAYRRGFLERLAKARGIEGPGDWKKACIQDVRDAGGGALLGWYGGSLRSALSDCFPEVKEEFQLQKKTSGFWSDRENRKNALEDWAHDQGINMESEEFWATVSRRTLVQQGLGPLVTFYRNSIYALLEDLLPHFAHVRRKHHAPGHWDVQENRRAFLEELAEAHDVKEPADWAHVSTTDVLNAGGSSLLARTGNVLGALRDAFPEHSDAWQRIQCRPVLSKSYWEDEENVRHCIRTVAEAYGLSSCKDWGRLSVQQACEAGASSLLRFRPLTEALEITYGKEAVADFPQDLAKRSSQFILAQQLRILAPEPAHQ